VGRGLWGVFVASLAACTHDDLVDRRACEQLRDHVIELRIAGARGASGQGPPIDFEPHRAALKQALGEPYLAACLKTFTATQVTCALGATDDASATECLTATTK